MSSGLENFMLSVSNNDKEIIIKLNKISYQILNEDIIKGWVRRNLKTWIIVLRQIPNLSCRLEWNIIFIRHNYKDSGDDGQLSAPTKS